MDSVKTYLKKRITRLDELLLDGPKSNNDIVWYIWYRRRKIYIETVKKINDVSLELKEII